VTDGLNVAGPDIVGSIDMINGTNPAAEIDRAAANIIIVAHDQSFSKFQDTVYAKVVCNTSGDIILKAPLMETAPGSGEYRSAPIAKVEGDRVEGDAVLQCAANETLVVTYVDEVYSMVMQSAVSWTATSSLTNRAGHLFREKNGRKVRADGRKIVESGEKQLGEVPFSSPQ